MNKWFVMSNAVQFQSIVKHSDTLVKHHITDYMVTGSSLTRQNAFDNKIALVFFKKVIDIALQIKTITLIFRFFKKKKKNLLGEHRKEQKM